MAKRVEELQVRRDETYRTIVSLDKDIDDLARKSNTSYTESNRPCFDGLPSQLQRLGAPLRELEHIESELSETESLLACVDANEKAISEDLAALSSGSAGEPQAQARIMALSADQQRFADLRSSLIELAQDFENAIDKRGRLHGGVLYLEALCQPSR